MERTDVVIVGGGIAGLATAAALARAGQRSLLLESEPLLASHSSGQNAAIWLPTEDDATTPELSRRSAELLDQLLGPQDGAWLWRCGALMLSSDPPLLGGPECGARRFGMASERLDGDAAAALAPALAGGRAKAALLLPDAGVLDIHAITLAMARATRSAGSRVHTGRGVRRVVASAGRVEGVELLDGSHVSSPAVVVASGAWAASHGASCGAELPLVPLRRHLVQLRCASPRMAEGPIVWALGDEVYFRPESGGVLASPCDETPAAPGLPPTDAAALESLAHKLRGAAPGLADARVQRSWACLRTFAPDRELVAGPDPRVEGLFWLAGLGGRGMTIGAAAGELAAACVLERRHPLAAAVAPERLL